MWVPIRPRNDKTRIYQTKHNVFGNSENVAIDILKSILNPVTEEIIMTGIVDVDDVINKNDIMQKNKSSITTENKQKNKDKPYFVEFEGVQTERLPYQNFHN